MSDTTPRWKYRFANYRRAYNLLREAVEKEEPLSQLEKEGLIQRFEYSTELAWKTLRDYLEGEGLVLEQITPRTVIRSAFEAGVIRQGETWQKALDARNLMSHTYDLKVFEQVIAEIKSSYLSAYSELYEFLMAKDMDGSR